MPTGIIIDALAVAVGGLLGSLFGSRLTNDFKEKLNLIFGICSMGIGISSIVLMKNMPAVVLALILGTSSGIALHFSKLLETGGSLLQKSISSLFLQQENKETSSDSLLITAIVLFCASGTGIYGAIVSGMTGDHSILLAKAILDFFTAIIFACSLKQVTAAIAIPQFLILFLLFACAKLIFPLTTPTMVDDFKSCGGIIMLATGFRIAKIKSCPIADMIPAMILVWPLSWLWANCITPLF